MAKNTNCLEGMRCPNLDCKSLGPFQIEVIALFTITDDGDQDHGDLEWADNSRCFCVMCSHDAKIKDFKIIKKKGK